MVREMSAPGAYWPVVEQLHKSNIGLLILISQPFVSYTAFFSSGLGLNASQTFLRVMLPEKEGLEKYSIELNQLNPKLLKCELRES